MIRLSGKEPERDVAISFIGARPGEKVHEELFAPGETWKPTTHLKIVALDVSPVDRAGSRASSTSSAASSRRTTRSSCRPARAIVREPQALAEAETGAAATATPASESV